MTSGESSSRGFVQRLFDLRLRDLGRMLPMCLIASLIAWMFWQHILGIPRLDQGADPPYLGLTIVLLMNLGVLVHLLRKTSWSLPKDGAQAIVQPSTEAFLRGRSVTPAPHAVAQPPKHISFRPGHGSEASDRPEVVPVPGISQPSEVLPVLKSSVRDKADCPAIVAKHSSQMDLPNRSARNSVMIELEEQDLSIWSVSFDEDGESSLGKTSANQGNSAVPPRSTLSEGEDASEHPSEPGTPGPAPCSNFFDGFVVGGLSVNSWKVSLEKSPSLATFASSELPLASQNKSLEPLEPAPSERPGELPVRGSSEERRPVRGLSLPSMAPPNFPEESKSFVALGDTSDSSPDGPLPSGPELALDSSPVGLPSSTQCDPEGEPSDALGSQNRTASVLFAPENPHAEPSQEARRSSVPSPPPHSGEYPAEYLPHDEPNHLDLAPFLDPRPSSVFDQIRIRLGLATGPGEEVPLIASLVDSPSPSGCQPPSLNGSTTISALPDTPRASSLEALHSSTEPDQERNHSSSAHATENGSSAISHFRLQNGQNAFGQSEFAREFSPVVKGSNPISDDRATPSVLPLDMNSPVALAALSKAVAEGNDSACAASPVVESEPSLDHPMVPPQPNVVGLESSDLLKVSEDHDPPQGPDGPTGAAGTALRTPGDPSRPDPLHLRAIPEESDWKSSDFDSGLHEVAAVTQTISARSPSPSEGSERWSHGSSMQPASQNSQLNSSQATNLLQAKNVEEITLPLFEVSDVRTPSYDQLFQQERDFVDLVCRHLGISARDLSDDHYQEIVEGFWITQSLGTRLASQDGLKFSVLQLLDLPAGGRAVDLPLHTSGEAFTAMKCLPGKALQGVRGSLEVTPDALVLRNAHGIQVAPVAEIKGFQVFSDRLAINFAAEKTPWFLGMRAPSRLVLIVWHLGRQRGS